MLAVLRGHSLVHGDLRLVNLMLEVDSNGTPCMDRDDRVRMKVVDFDWAGKDGAVHYPLLAQLWDRLVGRSRRGDHRGAR